MFCFGYPTGFLQASPDSTLPVHTTGVNDCKSNSTTIKGKSGSSKIALQF